MKDIGLLMKVGPEIEDNTTHTHIHNNKLRDVKHFHLSFIFLPSCAKNGCKALIIRVMLPCVLAAIVQLCTRC